MSRSLSVVWLEEIEKDCRIVFKPLLSLIQCVALSTADVGSYSKDAIQYFAGKIPVLGVCMGE